MVDLLGYVYVRIRSCLCHVKHGTQMQHQPAAGFIVTSILAMAVLSTGIGRQLPIAGDNVQTYSTRVCLLPATLRISLVEPRCWVNTRSSGRASPHGSHYAFGCVTGSNSRAHPT